MNGWIDELYGLCQRGERSVLVTVAGVRGSAPRDRSSSVLWTANGAARMPQEAGCEGFHGELLTECPARG